MLIFIYLFSLSLFAQTQATIATGRPGQSIGPNVVGSKIFQVQSGVDYAEVHRQRTQATWLSNNVFRYGITEKFELSSVVNYQIDEEPAKASGISEVQGGFRFNIFEKSKGLRPALGLQLRYRLPVRDQDYEINHAAQIFTIATNLVFNEKFNLTNNFSFSHDGNTSIPQYAYTMSLNYSLGQRLGSFIEIYGNYTHPQSNVYLDSGFGYLVNEDLLVDMSFGGGSNHGVSESFVSLGISWRSKPK